MRSKIADFVKSIKQQCDDFLLSLEEPEDPAKEEVNKPFDYLVGTWTVTNHDLYVGILNGEKYLVQKLEDGGFVVRAGEMLRRSDVKKIESLDVDYIIDQVAFKESAFGGLAGPKEFKVPDGYVATRNETDTVYYKKGSEPQKPTPTPSEGFVPFNEEKSDNTINWNEFEEMSLPKDHYAILGYGTPLWNDEPKSSDNKLKVLKLGYTHLANTELFHKSHSDPSNNYSFVMGYGILAKAAESLVNSGRWDYSKWGDPSGLRKNGGDYGKDWTGITREGAIELGKYIHYNTSAAYDKDTGGWSIDLSQGSWILFDEENFADGQGASGSLNNFLSFLQEGFRQVAPNRHIAWYGRPLSWFLLGGHDFINDPKFTDEVIENFVHHENSTFNVEGGFKNTEYFVDLSSGYAKTPYILNERIYDVGTRNFRRDKFTVTNFGKTDEILPEADDMIKQYGSPTGRPDTQNFVHNTYMYADVVTAGLHLLGRISNKVKAYVERRPRTEPWTFGGNSHQIREVGAEGIKFEVLFAYLSGVKAVSLWDDGRFYNPMDTQLPNRGTKVFDKDDNYSRFKAWTSAMQTFAKAMKGTDESKWQYVRFYYPIKGARNSEIISTGIYTGNAFKVMFVYPAQESLETTHVSLVMGGEAKTFSIKGRSVYFFDIPAPEGLTPKDFTLNYVNIHGKLIKVNGVITPKIKDHYL